MPKIQRNIVMFLALITVAYISTEVKKLLSMLIFTTTFIIPVLSMVLPVMLCTKLSHINSISSAKIGHASLTGVLGVLYLSAFWINFYT